MATKSDDRIRDLAQVIVAKHGEASLAVAVDRVRLWRDAGDEAWASIWTRVAGEVRRMTDGSAPRFD